MAAASRDGELRRALAEQAGLDVVRLAPADGGESGTVFLATGRDGSVSVVKIMPEAGPDMADRLRALGLVVARLRDRGYPAARIHAVGQVPGLVFWVQERLPGTVSEHEGKPAPLGRLLPELLRLNDTQAGLGGTGPGSWRDLLVRTLTAGGDGYCVHSTLAARPDTSELLRVVCRIGDRCGPAIPAGGDFVHYDFTPANLLSDGTSITGVIDVSPLVPAGDRAFDLATLLFYCYDQDDVREPLRARLLELTDPRAARAYLAHMVLRQVDWSLRYHPAAAATRRHLRLARLVIADIGG
jgi:Ser/Thr protein kinase RdoA (MazF antagonist)